VTSDSTQALNVTLSVCYFEGGGPVGPVDMTSSNIAYPASPYVGLIQGFLNTSPDLSATSGNYLYIGGVTQTPAGSTPQILPNSFTAVQGTPESVESNVWLFDPDTGFITVKWVNTDNSSLPTVELALDTAFNFLFATGNLTAFLEVSPIDTSTLVTFQLIDFD